MGILRRGTEIRPGVSRSLFISNYSEQKTKRDRPSRDDGRERSQIRGEKRYKRATFEMKKRQWSTPVGDGAAAQRTGGRRRHNAERQRQMWDRRFAVLRICALKGDMPHGEQQRLADHFGVHKAAISRDVAWARTSGFFGAGIVPRCSYRRRTVTLEWVNTAPLLILRAARDLARDIDREERREPRQPRRTSRKKRGEEGANRDKLGQTRTKRET